MKIVVQDASVLIDLVESGLADRWFALGIETSTSALVWHEVTKRAQKVRLRLFVQGGKLSIEPDTAEALTEMLVLKQSAPPQLSLPDLSVLRLAQKQDALLLTGDQRLMKTARSRGVKAENFLWLLQALVARASLTGSEAASVAARLGPGKLGLATVEFRALVAKWKTAP